MGSRREPPRTDAFIIVGGVAMIGVAFLNLKYHVTGYVPRYLRGEPWFDPIVGLIVAAACVLMIIFGTIRLIQAVRTKK